MSRNIRLTNEARNNLASISDYIAADSPANALRWLERIEIKFQAISAFPMRHEIAYSAAAVGREIRQTFFGVYQILYILDGDDLTVLTVRHGARRPLSPAEVRKLK